MFKNTCLALSPYYVLLDQECPNFLKRGPDLHGKICRGQVDCIFYIGQQHIQEILTRLLVFHTCFFISIFLLVYSMTYAVSRMKFDPGLHLAHGPDFGHPCSRLSAIIAGIASMQFSYTLLPNVISFSFDDNT